MSRHTVLRFCIAGIGAGAVNGLFGAGGGMILVPLLTMLTPLDKNAIFPSSISIIFPICLVSLIVTSFSVSIPLNAAIPYMIGSGIGGTLAAIWGNKIPVFWLHRGLGLMILWGGLRYLC